MSISKSDTLSGASNQEVLEQTQLALAEIQALYHVAHTLIRFGDLPELLQAVVDSVVKVLSANRAALITLDVEARRVIHFVKGGLDPQNIIEIPFEELWEGLSGWVIREMKPALSPKGIPDPRESLNVQRRRVETHAGSIIVVPVQCQNKVLGTLTAINSPEEREFNQRDVELMMAMAGQSGIAIENARLYSALQEANADLERRVAERTAELTETNARLQQKIAERDRVMQALQVSERRFRLLVENMNDGLAVLDEGLAFTYVNQRFCELLGYLPDELIRRPLVFFLDTANRDIFEEHITRRRKGEQSLYELAWTKKDGRSVFTLVSGTPLLDDDGKFLGSFAVVTDITERKRAEKEHLAHLRFFESMDQVNRIIQGTNDFEQMLSDLLDLVLVLFDCDRAFLLYPCDAEATSWRVPIERTRPEYPGAGALGVDIPMTPDVAETLRILLAANGPVKFGPETDYPLPLDVSQRFGFLALISMVVFPMIGKPWQFGLHQCSYPRIWTLEEEKLFEEIGRRLSDALTTLLAHRELQQSERELRQSNNLLRTIIESAPTAIIGLDLDGNVQLVWNPAAEKMLGWSAQEVMGRLLPSVPVESQEEFRGFRERIRRGESLAGVEVRRQRRDGSPIDYSIYASPLYDADGCLMSNIAVLVDITERKQMERTLAVREQEYRTLLENIPDLIVRYNTDLRRTYVNPAWEKASGLTSEQVVNVPPEDIPNVIRPVIDEYLAKLQNVLKTGIRETIEFTWVNVHGEKLYLSYTIVPEYDQNGKVVSILSVGHDITERRRAEKALQRYNQRLAILRDIDRRILVAHSPEQIAGIVLEHLAQLIPCEWISVVLYNKEITEERVFAWRHTSDIHVHVGESQPVVQNRVLERLKAGQSVGTPDLAAEQGTSAQLAEDLLAQGLHSAMASPLIVQGRLFGVLALAAAQINFFTPEHRQITEEIGAQVAIAFHQAELHDQITRHNLELEQRVRERTLQLENANRELELFSYSVSHDLRAPLRAIQGFAEIIARRYRDSLNEEGRRYFDYIVTASEQMNQLIVDLLDYARLGRRRIGLEAIPMSSILAEVIESLAPQIEQTHAQIHIADNLPTVLGDDTLLRQIFANLLENALVYHVPGNAPIVSVTCTPEPGCAIIRVTDNGIGIPAEFQEKIFNIFQRLHSPEQYPGTGIGLAIVRRSVELLNGMVWVESGANEGSTFYVKLPCPPE